MSTTSPTPALNNAKIIPTGYVEFKKYKNLIH